MERDRARGGGAAVIPVLPLGAIRAAIDGDDWPCAEGLLVVHERAVRAALAPAGAVAADPAGWAALLQAQCELAAELRARRDESARKLGEATQGRRGALAYLAGGRP